MSRLRAEMMPAVTVPPRPNGLPMATTHWPTSAASELAHGTAVSGLRDSTFSRARSTSSSAPTSLAASTEPSDSTTSISSAPSMTWLLVTTKPSASMMKPEPSEDWRRMPPCPRPSRSLNSLSGELGPKAGRPSPRATVCRVAMLTTDGIRRLASAEKSSPERPARLPRRPGRAGRSAGRSPLRALPP